MPSTSYTWAWVTKGRNPNVVTAIDHFPIPPPPVNPTNNVYAVDATAASPQPQAGWTYDGTAFAYPPALQNHDQLMSKATAAMTNNQTFLALSAPTTAQAVSQVQALTRQVNALIRLITEALDSTAGT